MVVSDNRLTNHTDQALVTLHNQAGFYNAQQYGLLVVTGKDAAGFLQSQLTNDINELKPGTSQFSCLLDRKAHVQAYFHLYKDAHPDNQSFYILTESHQIPSLVQNLEQYRFAAQVQFTDYSADGHFIAIQGPRANSIFALLAPEVYLNEMGHHDISDTIYSDYGIKIFRHSITGENGYFFWISKKNYAGFSKAFKSLCADLGFIELEDETVKKARIEAGLVQFGIDFNKDNLLPETGLIDKTVNYKKGCFVGQEILARVRSHGVPARAIIGVTLEGKNSEIIELPINSPILVAGEEIGHIKSNTFSPTVDKFIALTILKRDYRVPEKTFSAQIAGHEVQGTVTLPPFVKLQSNKDLAHKLYEQAVQKFVQGSEGILPTGAINLLQEVLILDPQLEDAYEALAVILSKHGRLDGAIAIMKVLAELNTDSVMAHSNLSQFYVQQGLKELAEEEKAIALGIRMRLAAAQMTDKLAEETEKKNAERLKRKEMFEQVLAIDKEDFFANAGFGECLVAEKDFAKAIPYLEKAIELKPIHLASYLDLAKAYKETKHKDQAKEILSAGITVATKRGEMPMLQKLQDEAKNIAL